MRYTQLCKRDRDVVEFSYPLEHPEVHRQADPAADGQHLIQSKDAIKSVYCPSDDARIDRVGRPRGRGQLERRDVVPEQRLPARLHARATARSGPSVLSYRPSPSRRTATSCSWPAPR